MPYNIYDQNHNEVSMNTPTEEAIKIIGVKRNTTLYQHSSNGTPINGFLVERAGADNIRKEWFTEDLVKSWLEINIINRMLNNGTARIVYRNGKRYTERKVV